MLVISLYLIILLGSCGYAVVAGRKAGQLTAALFIAASFLTPLADTAMTWQSTVEAAFIIDAVVLAALITLAMTFNHWWLIWCAGLQLAGVVTHAATLVSPDFTPLVYQSLAQFWSLPILLIMAAGISKDNYTARSE
jgi:hypothetical protein